MARSIENHPEHIALKMKLEKTEQLLKDAVRFIFLVGPALSPYVGDLAGMVPTTDTDGVTQINSDLTVTLIPSLAQIVITGNGTTHRLVIKVYNGQLTSSQVKEINFMVYAIKQVRAKKADPMLTPGLYLFGESEVMTGA